MSEEKIEAGLLRQVGISLVDVVLALLLVALVMVYKTPWPFYRLIAPVNPALVVLVWFIIYRFLALLFFNGTIGMKLFGVVLLNGELEPLSFMEKLMASFFILYEGVDYYKR